MIFGRRTPANRQAGREQGSKDLAVSFLLPSISCWRVLNLSPIRGQRTQKSVHAMLKGQPSGQQGWVEKGGQSPWGTHGQCQARFPAGSGIS